MGTPDSFSLNQLFTLTNVWTSDVEVEGGVIPKGGTLKVASLGLRAMYAVTQGFVTVSPALTTSNAVSALSATPAAAAAITVGASPFTYTNNDGSSEVVTVTGGTVTSIVLKRGGFTSASLGNSGSFTLSVGDALIVTYSAAPAMESFALNDAAVYSELIKLRNDYANLYNFVMDVLPRLSTSR